MSDARFADGLRYRIEIPSVEGPAVMRAVLEEAERRNVPVRRVSQGSGVMMLSDGELDEMAELGRDRGVEVCLFLGPRGSWDTGGQALVTEAAAVLEPPARLRPVPGGRAQAHLRQHRREPLAVHRASLVWFT